LLECYGQWRIVGDDGAAFLITHKRYSFSFLSSPFMYIPVLKNYYI